MEIFMGFALAGATVVLLCFIVALLTAVAENLLRIAKALERKG